MHMRIFVHLSTPLSMQKLYPDIQTKILFLMFQNLRNHDALWEIKSAADPEGVQGGSLEPPPPIPFLKALYMIF